MKTRASPKYPANDCGTQPKPGPAIPIRNDDDRQSHRPDHVTGALLAS